MGQYHNFNFDKNIAKSIQHRYLTNKSALISISGCFNRLPFTAIFNFYVALIATITEIYWISKISHRNYDYTPSFVTQWRHDMNIFLTAFFWCCKILTGFNCTDSTWQKTIIRLVFETRVLLENLKLSCPWECFSNTESRFIFPLTQIKLRLTTSVR